MDNQYLEMKVNELEKRVSDLQRDKDNLLQTLSVVSASVEKLKQKVSMLEQKLGQKVNVTDIQQVTKQSEVIKKINESDSVEMTSKVGISLDGRVIAESTVNQTQDGFKMSVSDIRKEQDK